MQEGISIGVVNPRVVMQRVVRQLRDIARDPPEQSLFWQPVAALPMTIPPPQRQQLTEAYRAAIATTIVPAYRRLTDFIERDYLPHTRTSVGMSALPNGEAWYRYQIRKQTTTDLSADEIYALGLTEVERIRGEIEGVLQALHFQGSVQDFYRHVQHDDRFFAQNSHQLITGFQNLKLRIRGELPRLFKTLPRADYEIRTVESFRAASAAGGSYQSPSADGTRPGIFYVNTHNLRAQPLYSMETLALHEGVPGHHYQFAIQQELGHLPRFQRFNNLKAYSEGWALYCESIGRELGLYRDPMQWYGHLNDEMLRAMRLVVDTGLHAKNWSREEAITFMHSNSSMADSDIVAEVERYIAWPGQALSYKIGQLRITALRARAEHALGTAFDVRGFHAEILRDGALPMQILDAKIDHWIAARRSVAQQTQN